MRPQLIITGLSMLVGGLLPNASWSQNQREVPTDAARAVAIEIAAEAIKPSIGPEGRPLPLASHWNTGTVRGTWTPDHQIRLIQDGHHILPWIAWPNSSGLEKRASYFGRLLVYYAELKLPFSIRGTQWEAVLVSKQFRNLPEDQWAGVIRPDGTKMNRLSPFGSVAAWKLPAKAYVATTGMKHMQMVYPDPPLVIFLSNNEAPDLRWSKNGPLEKLSGRYLDMYGEGRSGEFKRRVFGEGWIERYSVMFDAMRAALEDSTWQQNVRFVGYGVLGPSHFARWNKWKDYSLISDKWVSPGPYSWDGASPSYYTHNWNANRDYWVFSTQVESMNWVFMLENALAHNPEFWFEMSTWDGNSVDAWKKGLRVSNDSALAEASSKPITTEQRQALTREVIRKSKAMQYMAVGQDYPVERAAGWVQYGMWLLRPRVVREFRSHATKRAAVEPYWMEVVYAVDRVWDNEELASFWRFGTLVRNDAHKHPYQSAIPKEYRDIPRWYLLDTNLDAEWPWGLETEIPIFSLALVRGQKPAREWLIYAHAPLESYSDVEITIPQFGEITVDVSRRGSFYVVSETDGSVRAIEN